MGKKDFSDNPAMRFVNESGSANNTNIPDGYKPDPNLIETKTKRVQLVMQPSLYEKAKSAADAEKLSFNSYIHKVLKEALESLEKSKESEKTND